MRPCAACCRITLSFAMARSPITIPTRPLPGTLIRATVTELRGRMKTRCKILLFSRRTARINSRGSISCAPCEVSIHVCPAVCTCISAKAGRSRPFTLPCLGISRLIGMSVTQEFQDRMARIEGLVQKLEAGADPASRSTARELIQCLMELHGTGIERMLEIVAGGSDAAAGLIDSMGRDEL